ncbi:MAG: hypothetical protein WCZ86_05830 [Desulfurivibrionaceae bacterium]
MTAALRSESYRLNLKIQEYAKSQGGGKWKYAPITKYLRKGQGYGRWVARFSRYYVDKDNFAAYAGLIDKQAGQTNTSMRFTPISRSFASSARMLSAGFYLVITVKQQRKMAARLLNPGAKHFSKMKTLRGATRKWNAIHAAIPRVGVRRVAARPFVGPVLQQEYSRSVRNLWRLYSLKFNERGYSKTWMTEWGNQ